MVHMDSENKESKSDYASTTTATKPAQAHDINSIILYPFAHQVSAEQTQNPLAFFFSSSRNLNNNNTSLNTAQVGGHTQLLTLDKSTLCKPLIPRELLFYLNVPEELVKFVPAYKGKSDRPSRIYSDLDPDFTSLTAHSLVGPPMQPFGRNANDHIVVSALAHVIHVARTNAHTRLPLHQLEHTH